MLRLTYERKRRGWSQTELGRNVRALGGHWCEFRQSKVSLIELGRQKPTEDELAALASMFQISPAFVLLKPAALHDPDEVGAERSA